MHRCFMRPLIPFACLLALTSAVRGQDATTFANDLDAVVRQGRGTAEGRAAWERLSQAGPDALVPLLEAMAGKDTSTSNWLRTAFDKIADSARRGGEAIDAGALLRYA